MRFKRLESSNMIYRLAGRVFTTVGEAQEFYGLEELYSEHKPTKLTLSQVGIKYGFEPDEGIIYTMPSYKIPCNRDGKDVNILKDIYCYHLQASYPVPLGLSHVIPLHFATVNTLKNLACATVTLNAAEASHALFVRHHKSKKTAKLPWWMKKSARFHAVCKTDDIEYPYTTYTIMPFGYPFHKTRLAPVVEGYRAKLFEEKLEDFLQTEECLKAEVCNNGVPKGYSFEDGI